MYVKLIGCLLLAGSGVYAALSLALRERRRLAVLDGWLSLLRAVRGQIECFARPLPDILAGVDPFVLAACAGHPGRRLPEGWDAGVPTLPLLLESGRACLTPEAGRLLAAFTSEFGRTLREEQVIRCDRFLTALTEERRRIYEALPVRQRTAAALCLCATAASVILLW